MQVFVPLLSQKESRTLRQPWHKDYQHDHESRMYEYHIRHYWKSGSEHCSQYGPATVTEKDLEVNGRSPFLSSQFIQQNIHETGPRDAEQACEEDHHV